MGLNQPTTNTNIPLSVGAINANNSTGSVGQYLESTGTGTRWTGIQSATTAFGLSGTPNLNVGVVTASSFIGNLTGTASTAFGLSGTPNISVGSIVGSGLTISGISSSIDTRFQSVGEKTTIISGNTASLVYNTGGGNIVFCTNPTGDITLAVTGIPVDSTFNNMTLTFSVFVNQTGTARSCTAITLNGVSRTIKWSGGSLSNAVAGVTTNSGYDIYSFTCINTVGSASTTTNYQVLGSVNGGYA